MDQIQEYLMDERKRVSSSALRLMASRYKIVGRPRLTGILKRKDHYEIRLAFDKLLSYDDYYNEGRCRPTLLMVQVTGEGQVMGWNIEREGSVKEFEYDE
jgi:hypothetical protein